MPQNISPEQAWAWTEAFERRLAELRHRPLSKLRASDQKVMADLAQGLGLNGREVPGLSVADQ